MKQCRVGVLFFRFNIMFIVSISLALAQNKPVYQIIPDKIKTADEVEHIKKSFKLTTIVPKQDTNPVDSALVYIGYTPYELVIYIRNWQMKINASSKRRDSEGLVKQQEDCVYVLLASNGVGKASYWIGVNPLGAIADRMISNSGISEWDGDIRAEATILQNGWVAKLVIPFRAISYIVTTWGLQIIRVIYDKTEIQCLYPTNLSNLLQEVIELELEFDFVKKQVPLEFSSIISMRLQNRQTPSLSSFSFPVGSTFRFKHGTNALLDVTVNPDFSEVDVDIQRFSLDRLPINYPEKRAFFTEGSSLFKTPITLIRTRNLIQPRYGIKFYSIAEKNSFISYYINDTTYQNLSVSKYTYNPMKQVSFGTTLILSQQQYNLLSFDFSNYIDHLKTTVQLQASYNFSKDSKLYFISMSRNERSGISFKLDFTSIDSNFLSPFNQIALNFDRNYSINGQLRYSYYRTFRNRTFFIESSAFHSSIHDKYTKSVLFRNNGIALGIGLSPYIVLFNYIQSELNFLELDDHSTNVFTISGGYLNSSWNSLLLEYTFGKYLGGKITRISGELKFPVLRSLNSGLSSYMVKSNFDDLIVIQFFGEYQFLIDGLILKPYILYMNDRMNLQKQIVGNAIIIYEPTYLTGIYIALNRKYIGSDKFKLFSRTEIFKVQIGLHF